jgi:hypothetical protein
MDEFLNELYGTSETINGGEDLEKQAAAEFLVKLAEDEGVDLGTLSDDEVSELLSDIEGEMGKEAAANEDIDEEAQEKLAEADFLGRAMAHAYVNELSEIEKEAGIKETAGKAYSAARRGLARAGEATGVSQMIRGAKGKSALGKEVKRLDARSQIGDTARGHAARKIQMEKVRKAMKGAKGEMTEGAKRFGKRVGVPVGLLGTGVVAGKVAQSSDQNFEALATERAYEMLQEAGYDVEKVAQADVDTAALQMLEQAGYEVNWG